MKCVICIKEITKKVFNHTDGGITEAFCGPCYFEQICSYCSPPTNKYRCLGHEVFRKDGNRFLEDKNFNSPLSFDDE